MSADRPNPTRGEVAQGYANPIPDRAEVIAALPRCPRGHRQDLHINGETWCPVCEETAAVNEKILAAYRWRHGIDKPSDGLFGVDRPPAVMQSPLQGKVGERVRVVALWRDVVSHAKRAIMDHALKLIKEKGLKVTLPTVRVIDDQLVKLHAVDEYRAQRSALLRSSKDDSVAYREASETLEQIIQVPDLLILRLGLQRQENEKLPDIILECIEALRGRSREGHRGVWLVFDPSQHFGAVRKGQRAMPCWSTELQAHVEEHFPLVSLSSAETTV